MVYKVGDPYNDPGDPDARFPESEYGDDPFLSGPLSLYTDLAATIQAPPQLAAPTISQSPVEQQLTQFQERVTALGGRVQWLDKDQVGRVSFPEGAQMDITQGPGGSPVIGRGEGAMVFGRSTPQYDPTLGRAIQPIQESPWEVLGGAIGTARRAAGQAERPAAAFSRTITDIFGNAQPGVDEGRGVGTQYLPKNWQQVLPEPALNRLAATVSAQVVPSDVVGQVYPGHVQMTAGSGGRMQIAQPGDIARASATGQFAGGGRAKATGIQAYNQMQIGYGRQDAPADPFIRQANIPMTQGAVTAREGQLSMGLGIRAGISQTTSIPLPWDITQLENIARINKGTAYGGSSLDILKDPQGEALYTTRAKHYEEFQVRKAHISLPKQFQGWYEAQSQERQGMFQMTGGVVSGGAAVPSLVTETVSRRPVGGGTSAKGLGPKSLITETDVAAQYGAGADPAAMYYEAGPKDWGAQMTAIGRGLGVLPPGAQLYDPETGALDLPMLEKIQGEMKPHIREQTSTEIVTPGLSAPYRDPDRAAKMGVTGVRQLEGGNYEVTRAYQAYQGPIDTRGATREEYPGADATIKGEELAHLKATNPEYYEAVMRTGQFAEAHAGVMRSVWAGRGDIEADEDIIQRSEMRDLLSSGAMPEETGGLARTLAETDFGQKQIALEGGGVLPSARDIAAMTAENKRGESVGPMIGAWEKAVATGRGGDWQETAEKTIMSRGFLENAQTVRMPGINVPVSGRADVPTSEAHIGTAQFSRLARRIYGRNVSEGEEKELRQTFEQQEVIGKYTRYPLSDPGTQADVFARIRVSEKIGQGELAVNPLTQARQWGDFDAEFGKLETTMFTRTEEGGLQRDEQGRLVLNPQGLGVPQSELRTLQGLTQRMGEISPAALAEAQKQIQGKEYESEEQRYGDLLSRIDVPANEYRKHMLKEMETRDPMKEMEAARSPGKKQQEMFEAKRMMGMSYNAMRRDVAERSRGMGVESDVFTGAANVYQPALDTAQIDPNQPLGVQSGGEASLSFGAARLMEAFGSQSAMGGSVLRSLTGGSEFQEQQKSWEKTDEGWQRKMGGPGYGPGFKQARGEAIPALQTTVGQAAMFMGEATPEQMSAMLTGRRSSSTISAIREARQWAGAEGQQGQTAMDLLQTREGSTHMGNIMRAAGLEDVGDFMKSKAPLPQALLDKAMILAGKQIERGTHPENEPGSLAWHREAYTELEAATEEHLGMAPAQRIAEAKERQAPIDIMSGKTGTLPGDDPISALARQDLGYATKNIKATEGKVMSGPMDQWDIQTEPPVELTEEARELFGGTQTEPPVGLTEEAEELPLEPYSGGGGGRRPTSPSRPASSPQPSPSGGGGDAGDDFMGQLKRFFGQQKPAPRSRQFVRSAAKLFAGESDFMRGREGQRTFNSLGTGRFGAGKFEEFDVLVQTEQWLKKPTQRIPGWLRSVGYDLGKGTSGRAPVEGASEAFQTLTGLVAGREEVRGRFTDDKLDPVQDALSKFTKSLEKTTETLGKLDESGSKLDEGQRKIADKMATTDLRSAFKKAFGAEGAQFLDRPEAQQALGILGGGGRGGDGGGGILSRMGGAVTRGIGRAVSGGGMFFMNRMWNMTGGKAVRAQQVAMQEEMSVQRAQASWGGGGRLGGVSQGLLGMESQKNLAQVRMGRGAYMAYGGAQRALGGGIAGEMAGIAGPAAGIGLAAGYALGGPAGWLAAGAVAAYGVGQYAKSIGEDPNEMALRSSGNFFEQLSATAGGIAAEGRFGGIFNPMNQASYRAKILSPEGRQETRENIARGQDIRVGRMDRLGVGGQAMAIREWSERQAGRPGGGIMKAEGYAQMAGEWQAYGGGVSNLTTDLPVDTMEQMAIRGIGVGQAAQLGIGMGGQTGDFAAVAQYLTEQPNSAAASRGMQQISPLLQRFGVPGGDLDQYLQGANFQELDPYQQRQVQGLAGGNRLMLSQYEAGNLDVAPGVDEIIGGPQSWMQTMEATTGLPLHTTTGAAYSGNYGALSTGAAQAGGLRGIGWDQMQSQFAYSRWQEGQQLDKFQMGQVMQTGQQMAGMGGQAPGGFAALASSMGGMWGLQDAQRGLAADWQQYQFGYQQDKMDVGNRQWGENWQANWDKFQTQKGWQDTDYERQRERQGERDDFWLTRWDYQENRAQQSYGWAMEDIDENIRFSTGRNKLRLQRQKERSTITESGRREFHEAEKDNWEQEKEWREEDFERAKSHRDQINEWREEDLLRQKEHHNENTKMEQDHFDKVKEHYAAQKKLQDDQIKLNRAYWTEQQKFQAEQIKKAQAQAELQRELREDQWKLTTDAQDAVAKFQVMWNELGNDMTTALQDWNTEVKRFKAYMNASNSSRSSSGPEDWGFGPPEGDYSHEDSTMEQWYHEGGPVGNFADDVPAVLQQGEYVVPRGGSLVQKEDDRVVTLLTRIANALDAGNGRFTIMVQNPGETAREVGNVYNAAFSH